MANTEQALKEVEAALKDAYMAIDFLHGKFTITDVGAATQIRVGNALRDLKNLTAASAEAATPVIDLHQFRQGLKGLKYMDIDPVEHKDVHNNAIDEAIWYLDNRLKEAAAPQASQPDLIEQIADLFNIGEFARKDYATILSNVKNCKDYADRAYLAASQPIGQPVSAESHQWDDDGERCLKCGDKDWMAGPTCNATSVQSAEEVRKELESVTRMFHAACADLGQINEALGLDPDDGGAEPILYAIAELKAKANSQPVSGAGMTDELIVKAVHDAFATGRIALTFTNQEGVEKPTDVAKSFVRALASTPAQQTEAPFNVPERKDAPDMELTRWLHEFVRMYAETMRNYYCEGKPVGRWIVERVMAKSETPAVVAAPERKLTDEELPPLPEPYGWFDIRGSAADGFTADQMRQYALAALNQQGGGENASNQPQTRMDAGSRLVADQQGEQPAPEGFVIVPKEPTPEMMQAAWDKANELWRTSEDGDALVGHQYKAMIAAAPSTAQKDGWME